MRSACGMEAHASLLECGGHVGSLRFSSGGRLLLSTCNYWHCRYRQHFWDTEAGKELIALSLDQLSPPDGENILTKHTLCSLHKSRRLYNKIIRDEIAPNRYPAACGVWRLLVTCSAVMADRPRSGAVR